MTVLEHPVRLSLTSKSKSQEGLRWTSLVVNDTKATNIAGCEPAGTVRVPSVPSCDAARAGECPLSSARLVSC